MTTVKDTHGDSFGSGATEPPEGTESLRAHLAGALATVEASLEEAARMEQARRPRSAGLGLVIGAAFVAWVAVTGNGLLSLGAFAIYTLIAIDVTYLVRRLENRRRLQHYAKWRVRLSAAKEVARVGGNGPTAYAGPLETIIAVLPELPEWQARASLGASGALPLEGLFFRWFPILAILYAGGYILEGLVEFHQPPLSVAVTIAASAAAAFGWFLVSRGYFGKQEAMHRISREKVSQRAAQLSRLVEDTLGGR